MRHASDLMAMADEERKRRMEEPEDPFAEKLLAGMLDSDAFTIGALIQSLEGFLAGYMLRESCERVVRCYREAERIRQAELDAVSGGVK